MNPGVFGKPSPFQVGKVRASCPACGGGEFVRSHRVRQDKADALVCAACGTEHLRRVLLQQITMRVIEQADLALKRSAAVMDRAPAPPDPLVEPLRKLKEAEELLEFPAVEGHVERATKLLTLIARTTTKVEVRKAAMLAIGLASVRGRREGYDSDAANLRHLLARMRELLMGVR